MTRKDFLKRVGLLAVAAVVLGPSTFLKGNATEEQQARTFNTGPYG